MKWILCYCVMCSVAVAQHVVPPNQLQWKNKSYTLADIIVDETGAKRIERSWPKSDVAFKEINSDRYGRSRVLVYDAKNNIMQVQWIKQGAAFAYAPQPSDAFEKLWHIPIAARWKTDADQTDTQIGKYRSVRMKVHAVAITKGQAFLNSSEHWKEDFTIYIPPATLKKMDRMALENLKGKWVRVRGLIAWHYGPSIALLNPQMMEVDNVGSD